MNFEQQPYKDADARILAAAARVIRERGLAGASIRAIAREAGVLPGSVTYRYPSKDDLVVALMEAAVERTTAAVRAAIEGCCDPLERLRLAMRAHMELLLSSADAVWVLLYEWHRVSPEARALVVGQRDRYEALWAGLIYEAAGAGRLVPGVDLSLVRLFVFGAANSVALWYRPEGRRSPAELADAFAALIGLGVVSEAQRPPDPAAAYAHAGALTPPPHLPQEPT